MSDEQEPRKPRWRSALWAGPTLVLFMLMHGTASAASIWILMQSRQGNMKPPLFVEIAAGYTVVSSATLSLGMLGGIISGFRPQREDQS